MRQQRGAAATSLLMKRVTVIVAVETIAFEAERTERVVVTISKVILIRSPFLNTAFPLPIKIRPTVG